MKRGSQILYTEKLNIGHDRSILENLNLNVNKGEMLVVLGENGKGKSTLLKTISGNLKSKGGNIFLEDKKLEEWTKEKLAAKIAVVWTENVNIGMLSVEEFIAFGRYPYVNWLANMRRKDLEEIDKAIALCGIESLRKRDLQNLSDGEKQKVLIARAISQNTAIIILDEPTTHLDIKNTAEILLLLKNISQNLNKTIIISTHKVEMGLQVADKVWLMTASKVIQDTPSNILKNGDVEVEFLSKNVSYNKESNSFQLNMQ